MLVQPQRDQSSRDISVLKKVCLSSIRAKRYFKGHREESPQEQYRIVAYNYDLVKVESLLQAL